MEPPVPGDENLVAEQSETVTFAYRFGCQCGKVGTRLRLRQDHRSRPFPRNQFRQINPLQVIRSMGGNGAGGAAGQHRAERKCHTGGVPHFECGKPDGMGKSHTAERWRAG